MDWKLTKNYTIIFLIVLNILLLIINFFKEDKYKLSQTQKSSINFFLDQNDIKLYDDIPKKFYPMSSISMKKVNYNEIILQKIFFENLDSIVRTTEFENTIFKNKNNQTLLINDSYVLYEGDIDKGKKFQYSKSNSIKEGDEIKRRIEKEYGKMILDRVVENKDYFSISYNQRINNFKVFNNFLNVNVYKDGKITVLFNQYSEVKYLGDKKEICSADEAIYTFAQEIRNLFSDEEVYISQIDLGYFLGLSKNEIEFIFKPYYRFYIKNIDTPFYINAYTNTFEYDVSGRSM